jgi:hypothetical protein
MNSWIDYTRHTRHDIKKATDKGIAIRMNNGQTKTVVERGSMLHYVKYDCTTLVKQFRILK